MPCPEPDPHELPVVLEPEHLAALRCVLVLAEDHPSAGDDDQAMHAIDVVWARIGGRP